MKDPTELNQKLPQSQRKLPTNHASKSALSFVPIMAQYLRCLNKTNAKDESYFVHSSSFEENMTKPKYIIQLPNSTISVNKVADTNFLHTEPIIKCMKNLDIVIIKIRQKSIKINKVKPRKTTISL